MSEIRATTISDAAGTGPITLTGQYAAKAWVNFNGTSTVAIRESGNVSSVTDNGSGDYTVNFTTAMPDANYSWTQGTVSYTSTNPGGKETVKLQKTGSNFTDGTLSSTTSSARFLFGDQGRQDVIALTVAIFR